MKILPCLGMGLLLLASTEVAQDVLQGRHITVSGTGSVRARPDLAIAELGVTTAELSRTIRIATMGEIEQNAAKFSLSDRQIPIRVKLPELSRESLVTIENLPVQTRSGGTVPLPRVAEISFGSGPTTIQR